MGKWLDALDDVAVMDSVSVSPKPHERVSVDPGSFTAAMQARRKKVIAMLAARPEDDFAHHLSGNADPENLILTVGVRGSHTREYLIPKSKLDEFGFIDLLGKYQAE